MNVIDLLRKLDACRDAIDWAESQPSQDMVDLWQSCPRGDWLLWLAAKAGIKRTTLVFASCQCARLALPYIESGEERPLKCIETTEAWTRGEATLDQVRNAADAADAASTADAADAASTADAAYAAHAAASAVYDAVRSAYAASAAYAAYAVAYAAYAAASAAYAAYAAASAARKNMQKKCADTVREHISLTEVLFALEKGGQE